MRATVDMEVAAECTAEAAQPVVCLCLVAQQFTASAKGREPAYPEWSTSVPG